MNKLTLIALCSIWLSCGEANVPVEEAAQEKANINLNKLSWVLGSWYMDTPDGVISEEWVKVNDSVYTGFGMMKTTKGDTVFSEQLKLAANAEGVWYMPTVSNQNNGEEVKFKETPGSSEDIVFENPQHDFPQRIIYRKLSDSTMIASIEGLQNGTTRKEEFSYKRK